MEISTSKLRLKVKNLLSLLRDSIGKSDQDFLEDFLNIKSYTENEVDNLLKFLTSRMLKDVYVKPIAVLFQDYLLLLLSNALDNINCEYIYGCNFQNYQWIYMALAKLMHISQQSKRYVIEYFKDKPPPFGNISDNEQIHIVKKSRITTQHKVMTSNMLKCCYLLLKVDLEYFKNLWNWPRFIEKYMNRNNEISLSTLDKLYINNIVALLTEMSPQQLQEMNVNVKIPIEAVIEFDKELNTLLDVSSLNTYGYQKENDQQNQIVTVSISCRRVINIEGVFLNIFNENNHKFYANKTGIVNDEMVKVNSTKVNLRSVALGIKHGKAICLTGPVGCGKTTLIDYLARKTGRISPKIHEIENEQQQNRQRNYKNQYQNIADNFGLKRKQSFNSESDLQKDLTSMPPDNGFLRIQLGDQTDSKMLLGQYHCSDVPGEFIWLPGVLTQAVMNGYWLLLEDLDLATKDTYTILSGLLENNYISVPGFRDCVKVAQGFQLFVTVRTLKSSASVCMGGANTNSRALFGLLEKYLYTINILPLSRNELCKVVSVNYPKLKTIANRIVDVFLMFSSGNHTLADNLRQQEINDRADTTEHYIQLPCEHISISALTSGRLVSTRDLIKLCQRSNPTFSVTNMECANFVFRNAVDVFCSYLPQSSEKTKLIIGIGAKLGIIQSRCEYFAEEYIPEIIVNKGIVKIGRIELAVANTNTFSETNEPFLHHLEEQTLKNVNLHVDDNSSTKSSSNYNTTKTSNTFSFTRIAACMLERIAICVKHAEPVLLVGETGVGKTSGIQYLAERTRHKLVVINMNNQSDIADLIGGFKPVDISYVIFPLRCEFESIFRRTFNETKNRMLLQKFNVCYNQGEYKTLTEFMLHVTENILRKSELGQLNTSEDLLRRCQILKMKLQKLSQQLEKSINISFAFIPGSLVNCIKYGDWVLLDELNLASTETLECLSTILEPNGSVVLLEKGDFTPIKRHPKFRLFACMNPSTDVGKKNLPIGIRNRFTEFYVDDITSEKDLCLLVSDYLKATGIRDKPVLTIVKLYKRLKHLAKLDLNDGLGNRPVYSLRTLCRSLIICAKNLCGSIERNLYESLSLSFLTQLDAPSHDMVQKIIQNSLLTNVKAILNQGLPQPGKDYISFEGYWIQQGLRPLQECANYILTESVKKNLKDLARIISIGKLPILLQGPTSAGKTSLIEYIAKRSGNHYLRINNHEHTDLQEYVGTYTGDITGKLAFKEGVLVQAMRNGHWIILDELNLASTEILEALNRVLDDNRELFIPETQKVVRAHPNFMLFATQNPPGLYGGRKTLSRAFKNRFVELHFCEIPRPELEIILEKRCLLPASYAKKMVASMSDLQMNRKTTTKNIFTLRDLFRWGNRYTLADQNLLIDKQYDWNQHLVEEGYLVLSAKVRTELEITIIEDVLFKHFRKRVNREQLFHINNETKQCMSPITKDVITSFRNYMERSDIVWTFNMTRMAVLTAKALQFDEPVLLVGPTGCGKTTICQILAALKQVRLRILNCHMHTESADFLGGLRPYRLKENECESSVMDGKSKQLFEWSDGPLIYAMLEGSFFMADEISLAEDSVLERLNCILEPERTVLLAEKAGFIEEKIKNNTDFCKEFIVQAKPGFQFLATMNPGGDYGKKELSPALRNRFTEIWCQPSDSQEDLIHIANRCIQQQLQSIDESLKLARFVIDIVFYIKKIVEKFKYSIRDILSWAQYIINNKHVTIAERIIYGLETVFLDGLELLYQGNDKKMATIKTNIIQYTIEQAKRIMNEQFSVDALRSFKESVVEYVNNEAHFGIKPFFIAINPSYDIQSVTEFFFDAPTTKVNLFRLLSALTLKKPILLEGPPGVGKTSIVENTAKAIGYNVVRINLCEHTDLTDLFGTDLPLEDNILSDNHDKTPTVVGSFVWRDGPLLAALKNKNNWILLDELNLAPQSVLEGLNAILDHRGEIYIPELNKTFKLNQETRIFACQNPLKQGGCRKGLPQSFLNRFTKVYLRKLNTNDLLHVINKRFKLNFQSLKDGFKGLLERENLPIKGNVFNIYYEEATKKTTEILISGPPSFNDNDIELDLPVKMVRFTELLDQGITNMEFGYKGGPYEMNLRDLLRWCELLIKPQTGFVIQLGKSFLENFGNFLLIIYERMKLIYYQRMRCEQDKVYIRSIFSQIFKCDADQLNCLSKDVALYWTNDKIYLNDIVLNRNGNFFTSKEIAPLLLKSQREIIKNIMECVYLEKPVLLCGSNDTGKTKLIEIICSLTQQTYNVDTIDDSVTGSFQQIDLKRHLEEIAEIIKSIYLKYVQISLVDWSSRTNQDSVWEVMELWGLYGRFTSMKYDFQNTDISSKEVKDFYKRINQLQLVIEKLNYCNIKNDEMLNSYDILHKQGEKLQILKMYIEKCNTLNTGGHFEWADSKIVKCLKSGQYIALEHANLCSAAVLDRLNSVFESNGSLMLSEKGVTTTNGIDSSEASVAEIIYKHPNFQAFLTIDPKNGELSRAMRNRCVELYITKETSYDLDDKRAIVYNQGIHNLQAVKCLITIHENIANLTEIHSYNISHLVQAANLTRSYQDVDFHITQAIYASAMEIYVYSATIDLLGYGLDFYQNKLRNIVMNEVELLNISNRELSEQQSANYFKDCILKSNNLDDMTLIKLQVLPLKIGIEQDHQLYKNYLTEISEKFCEVSNAFELINLKELMQFLLFVFYNMSSFHDLKLRHLKLKEFLQGDISLKQLSNIFYTLIENSKSDFSTYDSNLPWNCKLFPRIRDYSSYCVKEMEAKAFNLQATLITFLLIPDLPKMKNKHPLSEMNILTYSQLLSQGLITDKFNNDFLRYYNDFLGKLHTILKTPIKGNIQLITDDNSLVKFLITIPWFKRLLNISQVHILANGILNIDLLHTILLHFKWLDKYLLTFYQRIQPSINDAYNDLKESQEQLRNYMLNTKYPMDRVKKLYMKKVLQFQPFYEKKQIKLLNIIEQMNDLMNIIPKYGSYSAAAVIKKFTLQNSEIAQNIIRRICTSKSRLYHNLKKVTLHSEDGREILSHNTITEQVKNYNNAVAEYEEHDEDKNEENFYLCEIESNLKALYEKFNKEKETDNLENIDETTLLIQILREWFLIRYITAKVIPSKTQGTKLNAVCIETLTTINGYVKQLIYMLNTKYYSEYQKLWYTIQDSIQSSEDVQHFEKHILYLDGNYRYLNSFNSLVVNGIQQLQLYSLSTYPNILNKLKMGENINSLNWYEGSSLINIIERLIFENDGHFRIVALNDYKPYKDKLQQLCTLLWFNSYIVTSTYNNTINNWHITETNAKRFLKELNYITELSTKFPLDNYEEYREDFGNLLKILQNLIQQFRSKHKNYDKLNTIQYQILMYQNSIINATMGALGLCLVTYTPLIDPVEKNRLKNVYVKEDIETVNTMKTAYDIQRNIMNYRNLNMDFYQALENNVQNLKDKELILKEKLAIRPQKSLYNSLVKDIQHFLKAYGEPKIFLKLLHQIQESYEFLSTTQEASITKKSLDLTDDILKKINTWLANAQRFVECTLKPYKGHYQDFVEPIQYAVGQLYCGLEGLKTVLVQLKNNFIHYSPSINETLININQEGNISKILQNLIEFPRIHPLKIHDNMFSKEGNILKSRSTLLKILSILPHGDANLEYFRLIRSKLGELHNHININGSITAEIFQELDFTYKMINEIWKEEEEKRHKQTEEENSLYINKTKCAEEDEELLELQEVDDIFPTLIQEDFGDFLQQESLENVMKLNKRKLLKSKQWATIREDDYKFIVSTFMNIYQKYGEIESTNIALLENNREEYIFESYKGQLKVFIRLHHHYRSSVNDWLEEQCINGLIFSVGLQQDLLKQLTLQDISLANYNFYKDPNVNEVIECSHILHAIEKRVNQQLYLYPEHAILLDIKKVIERIYQLPCTAPVVRFNTGFQILRQNVSQWNELAHKQNDLKAEELIIGEYVKRWTKLELQFWRNCLIQTEEKVASLAYKYWFFIYHLLQDYLNDQKINQALSDVRYLEQRYVEEQDCANLNDKKMKVNINDIIKILRQFIECSTYGDFLIRLQLLKSFEMYLHQIGKQQKQQRSNTKNLLRLISGLHNLEIYFKQFEEEIIEWKRTIKLPIEKKLKELVKIESYNKDLSYFNMRNNIARVHRNLNKFLREYQQLLEEKIIKVFQYKDNSNKIYQLNITNVQSNSYVANSTDFLVQEELKSVCSLNYSSTAIFPGQAILTKLPHLFIKSRVVVKDYISQNQYPKLLQILNDNFAQQLEHCFHLSNLNVDRSKERAKQRLQAKQILQQKRKGLTDLFKFLTILGLHYKSGLMELSIKSEYEDYTIKPFNLEVHQLPQQYLKYTHNLDLYYARSVFKLKLFLNIMMKPLGELDLPNTDRLKGFSIDMFLLVQKQRKILAGNSNELKEFTNVLQQLNSLKNLVEKVKNGKQPETILAEDFNFTQNYKVFKSIRNSTVKILNIMEQFKLLLKCQPPNEFTEHYLNSSSQNYLVQCSNVSNTVETITTNILQYVQSCIKEMDVHGTDNKFLDKAALNLYMNNHKTVIKLIDEILDKLKVPDEEYYLPLGQSLLILKTQIHNTFELCKSTAQQEENLQQEENYNEINVELNNIVENILLSLQKLYKKTNSVDHNEQEIVDEINNDEFILHQNHLRGHIFESLSSDWDALHMSRLTKKLLNMLRNVRNAPSSSKKFNQIKNFAAIYPILKQYSLMANYHICQQVAAHKISIKMVYVMLSVFVEIGKKGFCVPPDLQADEENGVKPQQEENGNSFGIGDDYGEKDASDKIESEDQLEDAKRPEDRNNNDENQDESDCKEEKGIEMSDDFDGKLQDIEKPENENDDSGESEPDEEPDKEMGKTGENVEKLDEQIWGNDEQEEQDDDIDENIEENGKGSKDEKDAHNDLNAKNEAAQENGTNEYQEDGLDAVNDPKGNREEQQKNDIDNMKEPEIDEEQINSYHNELEEPPQAEDMDLGDINNVDDYCDDMGETNEMDENPFDIDKMKENLPAMELDEETMNNNGEENSKEMNIDTENEDSDTGDNFDAEMKDLKQNIEEKGEEDPSENQDQCIDKLTEQQSDESKEQDNDTKENTHEDLNEKYEPTKDKPSKEDNVQSIPPKTDIEQQMTADQVHTETDKNIQQEQKLDGQDTGEDKEGVGQAENNEEDSGHQSVADTKNTIKHMEHTNEKQTHEKRKQGHTNEERTIGEPKLKKLKQLKTIDKLNKQIDEDNKEIKEGEEEDNAKEYQHIKQPKKGDKSTLDNATEEQSKKIQHLEDEENHDEENERDYSEEKIDDECNESEDLNGVDNINEMLPEKSDKKSEKPSKIEKGIDQLDIAEQLDVEGDIIETLTVARNHDTTAHFNQDQLLDKGTQSQESAITENLALKRLFKDELSKAKPILTDSEDHETWQKIDNRMSQNARDLCEQLRLILEPTKCSRLKGDYRSGRRINMKKIIPYIASQFRKDKIWLKRTKPAQRDYKITIAIDDSKSMQHNNSKDLTLEAISLVSQALTLLESGHLSVLSFGETIQILLNHGEQFDGPKLVRSLNFDQDKTKIADLLDFVRMINSEEGGTSTADNSLFENLLLIISDGRGIFSEGKTKVRNAIKLTRLQRIFLIYIIIDNPENKNSILDIQTVEMLPHKNISIKTYLDEFPFPYYVIVRDLNQLPLVLSEAMRQWFELVNSEQ